MGDPVWQLLIAALGGGTIVKIFELLINRGRSERDEWRKEVERLESRISSLEEEVSRQKDKVDDWRGRFYELLGRFQLLEVTIASKDQIIAALESRLRVFGHPIVLPEIGSGEEPTNEH